MIAPAGFVRFASPHGPTGTIDRLVGAALAREMTVFARISHANAAALVGLAMPPTEVLILGNPRSGTPLMLASPTLAIDLPLRMVIWTDDMSATWLGYREPESVFTRHGVSAEHAPAFAAMGVALEALATQAIAIDS